MVARVALVAGVVVCCTVPLLPAPPAASLCSSLTGLTIPEVRISAATARPAGPFTPPGGAADSSMPLPAFCRIEAVATPTPDSTINFEVWIPALEAWNGKFQGVGNGAWSGAIGYGAMASALRRGYATASTDTGHTGDDLKFAIGHPEKIVDWAERSIHVMTGASKVIVRASQGRLPAHSYFTGCSTGGAQGLTEAQRYPLDYDGIVASNPGNDRTNRLAAYLWFWTATHQKTESRISPAKLSTLNKAVLAACDGLDGLKDGVLDDPRRCHFDPVSIQCAAGRDDDSCLTAPQVEAVKKIYQGPRNARTGEAIFAGEPRGSELFGPAANNGWRSYVTEPPEAMRADFWRYFVFNDQAWDWRTFDWDRDIAYARGKTTTVNVVAPNLTAFKAGGGKLVLTAGWNDPIHLSEPVLNYYESVERTMGGAEKTRDFFRLFMVPGLGHCSGGPGTGTFDALSTLEAWVEHGTTPDKIVASRVTNGVVDRTRPLCPHPLVARWKGTGSSDDAANFSCVTPQ